MAAYENSRKQLLRPDLKRLIQHITNFTDNDVGYKQCEAFAFSQLLYHNFLSVNRLEVQRTIHGLIDKFNIQGFNEKAKTLETLVDKFVNADEFRDHREVDVQWSILQLMACLSDNPTSLTLGQDFQPIPSRQFSIQNEDEGHPSAQTDDAINWGEYLKEGNERFDLNKEENESIVLSDLEEGEGDVGEIEDDSILSHSVFSRNESFVERSSIERQTVNKFVDDRQPDYESSLKQKIQFDWWNDETLRIEPDSSHPYARLVTHWEELENKHTHGLLPVGGTLLMTEYKVVREALWMLQQPTSTFLFYVSDGGQVGVKPNISIPSLTPESLAQLLNESFCKYSEIILSLRNFIDDVNSGEIEDKRPPHTYQAYSAALQCQLNVFWQSICKLEKKIMIQA
ncbi:hypothetical protein LSTR_LSTR015619 [Laodelphax striatellus]|uniref:Gamma-tubulin complex component n=1 Tax=Laodelphax striatellus TaxID=195883 RepID=A0A482WUS6_LAOST|nr:hypothetical protein LSTR_LSTR015619 [Laodelphax striatellus]